MKAFSRRGFQLRAASLESRIAYTGFLALMLPGVGTLAALSIGRMGLSARSIAAYYRGGESEMAFPKTFWQLMETSHFHLFSIPVVLLILSHLLIATPLSARLRLRLTVATYAGALLEIGGPWAVRYLHGAFAVLLIAGWILLAFGMLAIVCFSLIALWGPSSWNDRLTGPAAESGEEPA